MADTLPRREVRASPARQSRALPPLSPNASLRWDVVSRLLPTMPGAVLEIGCGKGAAAARIARLAERYVACEPDPISCAAARENLEGVAEVHNCMIGVLPGEDRFDTVCAFEVLEHVEDDASALAEWRDRLNPSGTLLLSVPAWQHRMGPFDHMVGHFRRYDPDQIRKKLEQAGFQEVHVELYGAPIGYLLESARNLIARLTKRRHAEAGDYAQRTAQSGRLMQPDRGVLGSITAMMVKPMVWLQRLFPNRGVGLVARASLPR